LNIMNFSDEERETYESRLKWLRIEASALKKIEEKGIEKGLEKGITRGREQEKKEIALAMLKECLSVAQISKLTGLSAEELSELQK
ncbi:MAG: Rpn family recombination-promoting nuclease/putative transposase, partial [Chlamydiia bacterium]|nr:Rpn family recombination-promoting nuclease/putative transposase [Chlamydiia bacterium]